MVFFKIISRNFLSKYTPKRAIFQNFLGEACPEHLYHAQHAVSRHAYIHFWKHYLHASVKSCNVCAFISFWKKNYGGNGPLHT